MNDYAAAIEAFDEALRLYDANPGDIQRFDPVMDTTFKLAECHFKAGNEERARTVLSRALALRPEQAANESSGQAYNQFYGSIQSNFARSGSGTLEVDSSPSGLPLQINGVDVGTTPFSGTMPAGTHYLRVANDDGVGTGRAVEPCARAHRRRRPRLRASDGGHGGQHEPGAALCALAAQ